MAYLENDPESQTKAGQLTPNPFLTNVCRYTEEELEGELSAPVEGVGDCRVDGVCALQSIERTLDQTHQGLLQAMGQRAGLLSGEYQRKVTEVDREYNA